MNDRTGLRIAIYADGANVEEMVSAYRRGEVDGFTTNPTLMAKAGIPDYHAFAREVLAAIPNVPISFEVVGDDFAEMDAQAREIAGWGDNIFVKIPVCNTRGESSAPLVRELSRDGIKVNVTAVLTLEQVRSVVDAVADDTPAIVSIFAGRIADTGRDPAPVMRAAVSLCAARPALRVLWASPREVLNVYQAEDCGCHIVALTPELLAKLRLRGKNLTEFSRETVQMFYDDAVRAGYKI
ncbi:MAG TPA: transaldolase [Longimicrobiales bacterium]